MEGSRYVFTYLAGVVVLEADDHGRHLLRRACLGLGRDVQLDGGGGLVEVLELFLVLVGGCNDLDG